MYLTYPVGHYRILVAQNWIRGRLLHANTVKLESNFPSRMRHFWQVVCFNTFIWNDRLRAALWTLFHLQIKVPSTPYKNAILSRALYRSVIL